MLSPASLLQALETELYQNIIIVVQLKIWIGILRTNVPFLWLARVDVA